MNRVDKEIENWIKPFATISGEKISVDETLRETNPSNFFLKLTQPNCFESYAIVLHSFWVNKKIPKDKIIEIKDTDCDLLEEDFERLTWKQFYETKGMKFNLNKVISNSIKSFPFHQMNNELYPGEGMMDIKHLESLTEVVNELYGNQEIELFYTLLTSTNWEKDLIYSGKINDLLSFIEENDTIYTPSLIYPKEKNWAVNTDYDLSFSTIGGESKLIDKLVNQNKDEILKTTY